jgi:hypothetical protein
MQTYNSGVDRMMSAASVQSDGSSRSVGSSLREKIENRRSILNQVDDGMIRRTNTSNQQETHPWFEREKTNANVRQKDTHTPPRIRSLTLTELERFKVLVSKKSADGTSASSTTSPCPSETGRRLNEVTSRSICRSRQKKEAAEEKLRSLLSAAAHSFDSRIEDGGAISLSSEESSRISFLPKLDRALFDSDAPTNDENSVVCPSPRRATRQDSTRVFADMANLNVSGMAEEWKEPIVENIQTNDHFSQQMNILVTDNFFVFQM